MTGECKDVGEVPPLCSKVAELVGRIGELSAGAGVSARLSEGDGGNSMLDGEGDIARELTFAKCALGGSCMISWVDLVGEASVIEITTAAVAIPDKGLTISNSGSEGGLPA